VNVTIATLVGLGAIITAVGIALIARARRAGNAPRKPPGGRGSRPASLSALLPSLRHPLAVDATASEFDDVPQPRFTPVSLLAEPKEHTGRASAKGY